MKNRIFMDVPQIYQIADNLEKYSDIQTKMIDRYYTTAMKMVDVMEGKSKQSLATASTHIKLETLDAIGRMMGHSIVYNFTGKNRIIVDKEGEELAQPEAFGSYSKGKTGISGNPARALVAGAAEGLANAEATMDEAVTADISDDINDALAFPSELEINTAEYI